MAVELDGLTFQLSDFVGTDGLGHLAVQDTVTGDSGHNYPQQVRFPDRIFEAMLQELAPIAEAADNAEDAEASAIAAAISASNAADSEAAAAASAIAAATGVTAGNILAWQVYNRLFL